MNALIPASLVAVLLGSAFMDVRAATVRELVEFLFRHHGPELVQETAESLAGRLHRLTVRHGDDVLEATRAVGPRALPLIEQADEFAPHAARLLARHGAEATALVADPRRLGMIVRLGDDTAGALIRHGGTALPLLEAHGQPATRALLAVSPQNGRRLAMLHQAGDIQAIGRTDELLIAIARHGDRAMEFVWRNKGTLTVGVGLAAFLADPEPFLTGAADVSAGVVNAAVRPIVEAPTRMADGSSQCGTVWPLLAMYGTLVVIWYLLRQVWASTHRHWRYR